MAYENKEEKNNGLTPIYDTPRTGGNPQGVSDSVATPPNGGTQSAIYGTDANPAAPQAGTGGLLSRLASPTAATIPSVPAMAMLTPNAPTASSTVAAQEAERNNALSIPSTGGLVQSYLGKLTGGASQDAALTENYRQMFEAAKRGAARNPADGYAASKNRALKTAMGQAVRQVGAARPAISGVAQTTVRRNANGTTSRIGMVNNEEVDYGDMPENEANAVAVALADTQGIMDDFYGNDMDFMTNV